MAPGRLALEPTFTVTPMGKEPHEKHNFGAVIEGVDLEDISGRIPRTSLSIPELIYLNLRC